MGLVVRPNHPSLPPRSDRPRLYSDTEYGESKSSPLRLRSGQALSAKNADRMGYPAVMGGESNFEVTKNAKASGPIHLGRRTLRLRSGQARGAPVPTWSLLIAAFALLRGGWSDLTIHPSRPPGSSTLVFGYGVWGIKIPPSAPLRVGSHRAFGPVRNDIPVVSAGADLRPWRVLHRLFVTFAAAGFVAHP